MKKLLALLLAWISSVAFAFSPEANFAKKYVDDGLSDHACMKCISSIYMKKYGLTETNFNLDGYGKNTGAESEIVSDKPPLVVIEIANKKAGWALQLTYRVEKEAGGLVIVPPYSPRGGGRWVLPWVENVEVMYDYKMIDPEKQRKALETDREFREQRDQSPAEVRAAIEQEKKQKAAEIASKTAWMKSLQEGTETNCGPVLDVKKALVKVYFPVQNYGNEHWIKVNEIQPPGVGCTFVNGRYVGP